MCFPANRMCTQNRYFNSAKRASNSLAHSTHPMHLFSFELGKNRFSLTYCSIRQPSRANQPHNITSYVVFSWWEFFAGNYLHLYLSIQCLCECANVYAAYIVKSKRVQYNNKNVFYTSTMYSEAIKIIRSTCNSANDIGFWPTSSNIILNDTASNKIQPSCQITLTKMLRYIDLFSRLSAISFTIAYFSNVLDKREFIFKEHSGDSTTRQPRICARQIVIE